MPAPPYIIRHASGEDCPELARFARMTYTAANAEDIAENVLQQHLMQNMSDARFGEMLKEDLFVLAIEQMDILGFVQVGAVAAEYRDYVDAYDPQASEIRRLYVLPQRQDQGIGSVLLERALQCAPVRHSATTYLTTWQSNHGAQRLYTRFGFRKVGAMPEFDEDGRVDGFEYIMARRAQDHQGPNG